MTADSLRECRCTGAQIQRYLGKISGPLLDRIGLHIEVSAVPFNELRLQRAGASSTGFSRERDQLSHFLYSRLERERWFLKHVWGEEMKEPAAAETKDEKK